jgi:phosphatidylinositol-bisphosphatase
MGDLNFRLDGERERIVSLTTSSAGAPTFNPVALTFDQLSALMHHGSVFNGFAEAPIKFPPTYKYDPGTSSWDAVKLRNPSYTDRILFKSKARTDVKCLRYDSVQSFESSDHKPVWGLFSVCLRPGRDK